MEKIKTIGSSYMVAAGLTPGVEATEPLHVSDYTAPLASHCHLSSRILDLSGAALRSNLDRVCSPADALIGSNQQGIIPGSFDILISSCRLQTD